MTRRLIAYAQIYLSWYIFPYKTCIFQAQHEIFSQYSSDLIPSAFLWYKSTRYIFGKVSSYTRPVNAGWNETTVASVELGPMFGFS